MKSGKRLLVVILLVIVIMTGSACQRIQNTEKEVGKEYNEINTPVPTGSISNESGGMGQNTQDVTKVYLTPFSYNKGFKTVYGYIDHKGNVVIEPQFQNAQPFYENGIAEVSNLDDKYGLIDTNGNYVVKPEFDYFIHTEGLFLGQSYEQNTTHVFDNTGKLQFSTDDYLYVFGEGLSPSYQKGYYNKEGELVISLNYDVLGVFYNGVALVAQEYLGPSYFIDNKGNDITDKVSSGLRMFKDDTTELFGYKNPNGEIVIAAEYTSAEPFINGHAIVEFSESNNGAEYGVIDTKGEFVLEPVYCGIQRLSNGLVAVGEKVDSKDYIPIMYFDYCKKALFTQDFSQNTEWDFYLVQNFDSENVCVNDDNSVFFLDTKLEKSKSWPSFKGQGCFSKDGNLLRSNDVNNVKVLDKDGNILTGNVIFDLGDGIKAEQINVNPVRTTSLSYPVINGIMDKELENKINEMIKAEMFDPYNSSTSEYSEKYYDIEVLNTSFSLTRQMDLLIFDQWIYSYYLGAAHGSEFRNMFYLDIKNGNSYVLNDLFIKDSDVYSYLSDAVSKKMKEQMEEVGYWEDHITITPETAFALNEEGIILYFAEYEIASYAAGLPEFLIPYSDLKEYINAEGDFWKSFN